MNNVHMNTALHQCEYEREVSVGHLS